jgi:cysteine desulfurase
LGRQGVIDLEALAAALARASKEGCRPMLALQAANNETGVIQPVAAAAEMVHAANGFLVCDAVQAAGRIACDILSLGADVMAISAHEFGGSKGAGALCFRSDSSHIKEALLRGGGQERGLRAGTENVAAIAGMGAAAKAAKARLQEEPPVLTAWRDKLEVEISRVAPGAVFFGRGANRLPNTCCFALPFIEAQIVLISLDLEGVAVSSGSACSSGKVKPSHVLSAMGVEPRVAQGMIRVSLGWNSRWDDCLSFVQALERTVKRVRARQDKSAA